MIVKERERPQSEQTPAALSRGSNFGTGSRLAPGTNTVWNGKRLTFPVLNKESVPRWSSLQVEGLDELEFEVQSDAPGFTSLYPGDRVPLSPGGKVMFTLTVNSQREEPCDFRVYGFKHTTESVTDGGACGLNAEYRWMPPPSERDFAMELSPDATVLRPWHRWGFGTPKADVTVTNLSYMDMNVRPLVYRGEKPGDGRPISDLSAQTTASGMSRTWRTAIKPGKRDRSEDFALSAEAVISPPEGVADTFRVACEQVTYVEYVPFLRRWYDWILLLGGCGLVLLALVWMVWGVPEYTGEIVRLHLKFQIKGSRGQIHDVTSTDWNEVHVALQSPDEPGKQIPSDWAQGGEYQFTLPKRWLGMRWPIGGWNGVSTEQRPYKLIVTPSGLFEAQYKLEPSEPVRVAYADEKRKLYAGAYHVGQQIDVPLMVERKLETRGPQESGHGTGGAVPAPPRTTGAAGSTAGAAGGMQPAGQPGRDGSSRPVPPPRVPAQRPPQLPVLPTQEQQNELQYWCQRLGHQEAVHTLKYRPNNPNGVSLSVTPPGANNPETVTVAVLAASKPQCWLMLYDTSTDDARQMLGIEKNPMGQNEVIIDPLSAQGPGRDVYIGAISTEELAAGQIPALSGLTGNRPLEFIVVAVSGVSEAALADVKSDLREILGKLEDPKYRAARISVCGWRGEWQEADKAYHVVPAVQLGRQ